MLALCTGSGEIALQCWSCAAVSRLPFSTPLEQLRMRKLERELFGSPPKCTMCGGDMIKRVFELK
jgi:hypothetical protein